MVGVGGVTGSGRVRVGGIGRQAFKYIHIYAQKKQNDIYIYVYKDISSLSRFTAKQCDNMQV